MGYCIPIDQWGYSILLNFFMRAPKGAELKYAYIENRCDRRLLVYAFVLKYVLNIWTSKLIQKCCPA